MRKGDAMGTRTILRLTLSAATAVAWAQEAPYAAWRTLTTAHYRIHYPPSLADWAQDVGSRIEGIHKAVVELVGYESPVPVRVVLADPRAEPNGMALPLLPYPYVVLWRTEPRSDDLHGGAFSTWTEEVVSHELVHIHHLTRPSRAPRVWDRIFGLPLGPLVLKCPRWVSEGYATLAEGRITGSGRPHSAIRAATLRAWARQGQLPTYEALSGMDGYQGGNMAYLVGSAYLAWLERSRPSDPEVLRRFWRQLASRKGRTFDAAFKATFGCWPAEGYQRFVAETTHDALAWEARLRAEGLREGEPVLRAPGTLRTLEVSPDGKRLLGSLEARQHAGLCIWSLVPPAPPAKPAPAARPDPLNQAEDVKPDMPEPPLLARLPTLDHRLPTDGCWVDDRTIRFQIKRADSEGTLHPGPAVWRLGRSVDLRPVQVPTPRATFLEPVHREGRWRLLLEGRELPLPGQAIGRAVLDPAGTAVWAASEVDGIWAIVKVPFTRAEGVPVFGPPEVITRTVGGAWNPALSPDGRTLYFTVLDPRGMEVRRLDLTQPPPPRVEVPAPRTFTEATVMPPPVETVHLPVVPGPLPTQPYHARAEGWVQMASGMTLGPAGEAWQVGISGADLLGRLSWQALAGFGNAAGPRGAMAGVSSAAWAWKPALAVFTDVERPSRQRFVPVAADRRRTGAELSFTRDLLGETPVWVSPVLGWERVEDPDGAWTAFTRGFAGVRAGARFLRARGPWGVTATPEVEVQTGTTRADEAHPWTLTRASLAVRFDTPALPVRVNLAGGRLTHAASEDRDLLHLGGQATSLVPVALDATRLEQPALPAFLATGDRFLRWRGEAGGTVSAYLEGTALWREGASRPPWLRVAGLRAALDNPLGATSEETLRRMRLEIGVHRPLDGAMRNRTVATVALILRP